MQLSNIISVTAVALKTDNSQLFLGNEALASLSASVCPSTTISNSFSNSMAFPISMRAFLPSASTTNTTRLNGPAVGAVVGTQTFFNGYFREDYVYTPTSAGTPSYLDEHNGRFCVTPEYPAGIYCYYSTVDASWNSAYPYVVGPTFYGVYANRKVTAVDETTIIYTPATTGISNSNAGDFKVNVFPNPSNDFIAIQVLGLNNENLSIELFDVTGRLVQKSSINAGATNTYLDTKTLYAGSYLVKISGATLNATKKVVITK